MLLSYLLNRMIYVVCNNRNSIKDSYTEVAVKVKNEFCGKPWCKCTKELQENENTMSHMFPGTIHSFLGIIILLNLTFLPPIPTIWSYRQGGVKGARS